MLLINFSYNINDFEKFVDIHPLKEKSFILDFASTISKDKFNSVIYPSDLDKDNEIHKIALNDYVHEMGKTSLAKHIGRSQKDIRSLNYDGLSLYWLTAFSEKHPQNCVLKNVFYFKHLSDKLKPAENITIILPSTGLHFSNSLQTYLIKKGFKPKNITFNRAATFNYNTRSYISHLRHFYSRIYVVRQEAKKNIVSENIKSDNLIFTYFPQTWKGDNNGDKILNGIEHYSEILNKKTKYIPYFFDYSLISSELKYKKWDQQIFSAFPNRIHTFIFCTKLLKLHNDIKKINFNFGEDSFVDNTSIKHELYEVLQSNMEYLFNYAWLKLYFKTIENKVKVFYQDEFYIPGRIISSAVKNSSNKKISTYGVQHGIFYEAHTVYSITNDEIGATRNRKNGYPFPDSFIVWGNYFKNHFLKFNSLNKNFVVEAGNIKYIKIHTNKVETLIANKPTDKIKMLWCTTLQVDTVNQYKKLLKQFLNDNPSVQIIARCHPLVDLKNFIYNDLISEEHKASFFFSETSSIFDEMQNCNIVLSTSGSTIFLDAMVVGKPIFNLVNDDYFMGDLGQNEMENIKSKTDLQNAFNSFMTKKYEKKDYSKILHLSSEKWLSLLK
ncbi:MAG: hypothetical protein HYX39_12125 [Bacteroidetes bacterium]|nr:hypothetical protein [Bacteroidota bacterium]